MIDFFDTILSILHSLYIRQDEATVYSVMQLRMLLNYTYVIMFLIDVYIPLYKEIRFLNIAIYNEK